MSMLREDHPYIGFHDRYDSSAVRKRTLTHRRQRVIPPRTECKLQHKKQMHNDGLHAFAIARIFHESSAPIFKASELQM